MFVCVCVCVCVCVYVKYSYDIVCSSKTNDHTQNFAGRNSDCFTNIKACTRYLISTIQH